MEVSEFVLCRMFEFVQIKTKIMANIKKIVKTKEASLISFHTKNLQSESIKNIQKL